MPRRWPDVNRRNKVVVPQPSDVSEIEYLTLRRITICIGT